jgi:hypothetical protein
MKNPFTNDLARDAGFCNRKKEIATLCRHMTSGIHCMLYAPRRYGKSSLAHVVLNRLESAGEMVPIYVDLFKTDTMEDVARTLYREIVNSLGRRAADKSSVGNRIMSFFKLIRLTLRLSATPDKVAPEFEVSLGNEPPDLHLETIISSLDAYCEDQGVKVCLCLDEFQEICNLAESRKIEALLRGGMQACRHVSFLFMGSRRTILRDMFEDQKRPFYKSAMVIPLPRIPKKEFETFILEHFNNAGLPLSKDEAAEIVSFSEGYPGYVQKLAMICFETKQNGGTLLDAENTLIEMESGEFEGIYLGLTNTQKRLIRAIAEVRPTAIFSQQFIKNAELGSQGGVQTSLKSLIQLDLIEPDEDSAWRVVDPIFARWLMR